MQEWISQLFENKDMLKMGHAQRLADLNLGMGWIYYGLARLLRPKTALVICSWRGFVPIVFGKALLDNQQNGQVLFVDPSFVDGFWKEAGKVRRHFVKHGVTNIEHFLMTTQQFCQTERYRELQQVEIVFIDGYHTQEQARFDFEAFQTLVPASGVLLFHDSCRVTSTSVQRQGSDKRYRHTVKFFLDTLKRDPNWQVLDLPFVGGLSIVRKVQPPEQRAAASGGETVTTTPVSNGSEGSS